MFTFRVRASLNTEHTLVFQIQLHLNNWEKSVFTEDKKNIKPRGGTFKLFHNSSVQFTHKIFVKIFFKGSLKNTFRPKLPNVNIG